MELNKNADPINSYQELMTNHAMYKAIMTNSMHAMFIATPDDNIIECNPAACQLFGYTEAELKNLQRSHFILHDERFTKLIEERKKNGSARGECVGIKKNGEHILCEISSALTNIDGHLFCTIMMVDITEKKKLEKLLESSNQMAVVGGWELDLVRDQVYWTSVSRLIHETDEHVDINTEVVKTFYKNKVDQEIIESAIRQGEPFDLEVEIVTARGNERWIRVNGKPEFADNKLTRYYGSVQDITSKKQAHLELEKSKQEYQSIFDNSVDSILSVNLDGIIQMANPGASELFECPAEELIGQPLGNFTPPESIPFFTKNLNEIGKGKSARGSVREIITAKGNKKIIMGNMAPIRINNQIVGISAIANDITKRQHYQQELEFHSQLLNTIQQAVKVIDIDGTIIYWNDYCTKLYGWTKEETLGKKLHELKHRIMPEPLQEDVHQKLLRGETWSGELTMVRKDGSTFAGFIFDSPFKNEAGNVIGILSISFDNTKEVASRRQIEFQAQLLNTIQQAVVVVDLQGNISYWSDYATQLYGWERSEALGKSLIPLLIPASFEQQAIAIAEKMNQGGHWSGEFLTKNKQGQECTVYAADTPLYNEEGNLAGTIIVSFDNTKEVEKRNQMEFQAKLLNTIQQVVIVYDLETKITYWNDYATELYGWKSEEVLGKYIRDIIPTNRSAEEIEKMWEILLNKKMCSGEVSVKTKDNKTVIVHSTHSPVVDQSGKVSSVISVAFNITQEVETRNQIQFQAKLLNTIQQAVVVFSLDNKISYWNEYATKLYGWTTDEAIGQDILKVFKPELTPEEAMSIKQKFIDEGGWAGELTIRTKEDKQIIVYHSQAPILDEAGELSSIITISFDITKEVETRNHIQFQAKLLNTIQQAVVVTDPAGSITYMNDHAIKMYGWSREEAYGLNVVEIGVAEPSLEDALMIIEKLKQGETWSGEITVKTKDSTSFIAQVFDSPIKDENGNLTGSIFVSFDKTEEIEKRNHIQFQAMLLSTIQEAVMVFDLENKITYWNDSATKLYGWTLEEVIGRNVLDIVPPDLSTTDITTLKEKAWNKEGWSGELAFRTKENKKIIAHVSHAPLLDEAKNILGIISVTYDITKEVKSRDYIRFQAKLLDSVEQAVFSADRDGTIIYWNHHAEKLYGWNKNEIIGKKGDFLVYPDPATADVRKEIQLVLREGKSWSGEFMMQSKTGKHLPVFSMVSPTFNDNHQVAGLISVTYDISKRKEEERQRELEQLDKEALINTSQDYIWSIDKNYVLLAANQSLINVIKQLTNADIRRGEVFKLDGLFPDAYVQFLRSCLQRGLSRESFSVEYHSSLTNKWFDLSVRPILNHTDDVVGVACYNKDITQRKEAEETVRISNERYNFVSKATNDCIWDWNIVTNQTLWSGNMETLFGYPIRDTESINATFWVDRIHPEDRERVLNTLNEIFHQTVQNIWQEEYRFLKADGTYAYVYDKAYIIRDEMNMPLRMIGAMQDITHRKETELLLKDLNEKIKQRARDLQESNSELERFAYVASHDLQEPLRMVSSFLLLLDKRLKETNMIDAKSEQYMGFAVDGANRMKRLILDLLEYSRISTSTDAVGNTNMNDVVHDVKDIFRVQINERNVAINTSLLPVLPNTRRTQMVQLLQNLVGNALKYNISTNPTINIDVKEDDHRWIFSVQDNGIGFEPKFAEEIFTIFQRLHTRSEYTGTGIGLSICKKIVERHGGKIWAESTVGTGSTFYFSIPKSTS